MPCMGSVGAVGSPCRRSAAGFVASGFGNLCRMTLLSQLLGQLEVNVRAHETELVVAGIVSIALGILIFAVPRLLNYIVAAYLIIVGVIWLIAGL